MQEPPVLTRDFLLLMLGHFLQSLGWSSLLLMPLYLDHLGATRTDVGVVLGAAAVGGLVVRPLVGWALDRVGRKPTLVVGTAFLSVGMASVAAIEAVGLVAILVHVALGIGMATLFTGYFTFAADVIPASRRTEGLALFGISGLVTMLVNPIAQQLGVQGAELRWFFPGLGLLVAASAVSLVFVRERQEGSARSGASLSAVLAAFRARPMWSVWLATMVFSTMVAVFSAYVSVVAEARGVPNPSVGWLTYGLGAVTVTISEGADS